MFHVSQGGQGGVLSPILFTLYVNDAILKQNETDLGRVPPHSSAILP